MNYLGHPGTMGARYIDYLIADRRIVPEGHERHYREKIVCLPDSYQANDRKRRIAERIPTRAEEGLPDTGFVFCSFNGSFKITPEVFDIWMRLLKSAEGSALWLLDDNPAAVRNLKREAEARGVSAQGLVFAPRKPLDAHLARHRLADLFLDTLPCNAHTTASDALWAGLPVLTCTGNTFAGRVAASLLFAVELPELITDSLSSYEALAMKLARDQAALAQLKAKLTAHCDTAPLFDTKHFARHLESAVRDDVGPLTARDAGRIVLRRGGTAVTEADLGEAWRLHRAGEYDKAARLYLDVLRDDPRNYEALHRLAFLCGQLGRWEDSQSLMAHAIALNPSAPSPLFLRGSALQKLNRHDEAVACFDRALGLNPGIAEVRLNCAASLYRLRRYEEAGDEYGRLLDIAADFPFARGNRLFCRLQCCDWRSLESETAAITADMRAGKRVIAPFDAKALFLSAEDEPLRTRLGRQSAPRPNGALATTSTAAPLTAARRLISADFREGPLRP